MESCRFVGADKGDWMIMVMRNICNGFYGFELL